MATTFETMHDLMRFLGATITSDPEQDAEALSNVLFAGSQYRMWAEIPNEQDRRGERADLVVGVNVEGSQGGDATFKDFVSFPITLIAWEDTLNSLEEKAADCLAEWAAEDDGESEEMGTVSHRYSGSASSLASCGQNPDCTHVVTVLAAYTPTPGDTMHLRNGTFVVQHVGERYFSGHQYEVVAHLRDVAAPIVIDGEGEYDEAEAAEQDRLDAHAMNDMDHRI